MRKHALMVGGALALACSSNANAALVVLVGGDAAGTFRNFNVKCAPAPAPCSFTDTATFVTPQDFTTLSATISSILNGNNDSSSWKLSLSIRGFVRALRRIPMQCGISTSLATTPTTRRGQVPPNWPRNSINWPKLPTTSLLTDSKP